MRQHTLRKPTLVELLTIIDGEPGGGRHIFRGQGNSSWGLTPSLYRGERPPVGAPTEEAIYDYFENMCIDRFFSEGLPYLPSLARGFTTDRILAQHFGVPTRLLDWSMDPIVSAYFAVEKWDEDCDAAIFMILPDYNHRIEDEKGMDRIRLGEEFKAMKILPPAIDRRIPAQKSVFTMHPYGPSDAPFERLDTRANMGNTIATTGDQKTRGFAKIVIPFQHKKALLHNLLVAGVDRRNLFPGLDGVGVDIGIRARLGLVP